jgi:CheY-like chemotaxis protein
MDHTALPLRVLVVDDDADTRDTTACLLRMWGHRADTAGDGASALALAGSLVPDVVVLDIGLPRMDGYRVARRLREQPALAGVYVLCMTGFAGDADRALALEAGCDEHWPKPVEPDRLRDLLASLPRRGAAART